MVIPVIQPEDLQISGWRIRDARAIGRVVLTRDPGIPVPVIIIVV